jgi:transposase-like protein
MFDLSTKQAIINEYLVGGTSLRLLGNKHNVHYKTINRWVLDFCRTQDEEAIEAAILRSMKENPVTENRTAQAARIRELEKQLEQERLHNKLLTAMIDIAEEELHIPIRKKYGTKQSKK